MAESARLTPGTDLSPEQVAVLLGHAERVAENAYAPYSRFRVGAALLLTTGEIITGCNVENASYRLTTCAEQSAIASAVSRYGPGIKLRAVLVANLNTAASQPCGACRQTIFEFSTADTRVYYPAAGGQTASVCMAELLPEAFHLEH